MAHYYAFCEKHKKCGPDRDANHPNSRKLAWQDCIDHRNNTAGAHGQVYVKLSTSYVAPPTGLKKFRYKLFKTADSIVAAQACHKSGCNCTGYESGTKLNKCKHCDHARNQHY